MSFIEAGVEKHSRGLCFGIPPTLRQHGNARRTGIDQGLRIGSLPAARGRIAVGVFETEVREAIRGERQADVSLDEQILAIALEVLPIASDERRAVVVIAQTKIEHARNGIRTIERGGSVPKDFELADGDRRNRGQIGALRATNVRHVRELDGRTTVTTFAVDEHERLVRRQPAQAVRTRENRSVIRHQPLNVHRRHLRAQHVVHVTEALIGELFRADDVNGQRRLRRGQIGTARARDDDFLDRGSRAHIRARLIVLSECSRRGECAHWHADDDPIDDDPVISRFSHCGSPCWKRHALCLHQMRARIGRQIPECCRVIREPYG